MNNYGIIKNGMPAERQSGLVFAERFENASEVVKNGGVITGTKAEYPIISNVKTVIAKLKESEDASQTVKINSSQTITITAGNLFGSYSNATAFDADDIEVTDYSKFEFVKMFSSELSALDITNYTNGVMFNYLKDAELVLPMRLDQHDPSGLSNTEEIVDGDMEDAGTTAWLIANGAVLSKEDDAGTQVLKMMRTAGGSQYPYTYQEVLATLTNYIVSGRYKIVNPAGGVNFRVGTTTQQIELGSSTTWKSFSEPFTTTNVVTAFFHLHTVTSDATYVLIDDISIKEAKPRTLDVSGKGNHATFGDGTTTSTFPTKIIERHGYDFDGTTDYFDDLPALTGDFSVVVFADNEVNIYNTDTVYETIKTAGGFTGNLQSLIVYNSILSSIQEVDTKLNLLQTINQI